ncbi:MULTISPECIES: NADH-quinone oxidoreductase subunit L [unclassified Haematobacter]|uniref:NADH-quinone oxidoreductase subunit L n=1 Tax=unclassified Haematobacter TaxID=2640585 RepID=UPI0025C2DA51|nr:MULTISPECIES: NADH-quinone oxidoreductase subunit L [unclassified Haematobacter]
MEKIIVFGPLLAAIIGGFGWRIISERGAQFLTTGLVFFAAILSWVLFLTYDGEAYRVPLMTWLESGTLYADWSLRIDRLTTIMLIVVNTVSALVHLYSFGYMAHDDNFGDTPYRARFFAYLSFFTFTMLMLVTSDNLLQMFFGWEGVGVASYLLIGFYYKKQSAGAAAMKAFIVNRVGDFGFILGIAALYFLVDSIRFDDIFAAAPSLATTEISFLWRDWNAANLVAFLLFIGAMGKSAQLFLHTWLPDAMEGPTPVSALIHAATMVTAGVFLVCRMSPLIEFAPETKTFIVIIGASTAFFAATVGLVQNDIKRVIAYSTCSQLGYMFVAAGVGVYSAAMFHLLTHAFFKAMLFLGAGSVIHAMHHEQDLRNYGGLRKKLPVTYWMMMIGTLAITGVGIPLTHIGFAGFLSKDAIIESAWAGGTGASQYAFWMLVIAAFMTSFYSWRLMFLTFFGKPRDAHVVAHDTEEPDAHANHQADHHSKPHDSDHGHGHHGSAYDHAHESPRVMLVPMIVLAFGAVFAGMIWQKPFFGDHHAVEQFFSIPAQHEEVAAADHGAVPVGAPVETAAGEAAPADHAAAPTEAAPATAEHAAVPAKIGAIFMHPDNHVMENAHHAPVWVKVSPFIAMLLGLGLAYVMYIRDPSLPARVASTNRPLYKFLLNKWYFDEIYLFIFIRPAQALGRFLWKNGDGATIDGGINGLATGIIPFFARLAGRLQSGYLFHYAFAMVVGIALLVTWMTLWGGAH